MKNPLSWVKDLRMNRYATICETPRSIYIICEDQGTIGKINKLVYPSLHSLDIKTVERTRIPTDLLNWLVTNGIFVPIHFDEHRKVIAILRRVDRYSNWRHLPTSVHLFLTHDCNFRCTYCIQGHELKNTRMRDMTRKQVTSALNYYEALCDKIPRGSKPRSITLFGGEPLLPRTYDVVKHAIEEITARGLKINIVTNGYFYNLFSDLFSDLCQKTDISFLVSLDGPPEVHNTRRPLLGGGDSFNQIVENISLMLNKGFEVILQPITDEQNVLYIEPLYEFCSEIGWLNLPKFSMKCGITTFPNTKVFKHIPYGSSEKTIVSHLLRLSHKFGRKFSSGLNCGLKSSHFLYTILLENQPFQITSGCPAIRQGNLSFCPDGFVYPCHEYAGRGKSFAIAKYTPKPSLLEETFQSWFYSQIKPDSKCFMCKHILICAGGCRVSTETSGRSIDNPECPDFEDVWQEFLNSYDMLFES